MSATPGNGGSRPYVRQSDPAAIGAELLLLASLGERGVPTQCLRTPGLVAPVLVGPSDWVEPARQAWATLARRDVGDTEKASQIFAAVKLPCVSEERSNNERFAIALRCGHGAIGFAGITAAVS